MTDTLESLLRDILIELRVQTKMLEQMLDEPDADPNGTLDDAEAVASYQTL